MQTKIKSFQRKVNYGAQIVLVGALTGAFAGVVVTLYNVLVVMCEEFAVDYYKVFLAHPWFIPLLFAALFLGGIVIGGVLKFLPMIKGSGFPQTEGATQGLLRFKWYKMLTGMFAASLFVVFMGLSAGAEGPSLMIGGACGDGVSSALHRNSVVRRYQITGGACAGLAVALNAPLTGMIFAYEEAHKRFTPEVFVCSFSSVVMAVVVRNLLRPAMGLPVGPFLSAFVFSADTGLMFLVYTLAAALLVAFAGVAFYFLLFFARRHFKKLTFWKGLGRYTIPFVLAGAVGLVTVWAMGGGVELIQGLGSNSEHTMSVFGAPLWASLFIILLLKFIVTVVNTGMDLPCCASIPMMAMGAVIGRLCALLFGKLGMDPALSDPLVVICMVTFFTAVVKAPLTGIIMTLEMTWNFTFLLPAVVGVAVAYVVGDIFRTEPLYERLLEELVEERDAHAQRLVVRIRVTEAAGRAIEDILWPFSAYVTEIRRGNESVAPRALTVLEEGDILSVEGTPERPAEFMAALTSLVGEAVDGPQEMQSNVPGER